MTKISTLLCLSLASSLCACGGDDTSAPSAQPSDSQIGLSDGPWDPESCSPQAQAKSLPSTCKQSDFDAWNECVIAACQTTFDTCFGKGRSTGDFSGPCAPYTKCAVACKCSDSSCTSKCPGAQACADCYAANLCGGDCTEPACAPAGTGADSGKTCADLKRCCATISNPASAQQCMTSANTLDATPGGGYSCAALYSSFKQVFGCD